MIVDPCENPSGHIHSVGIGEIPGDVVSRIFWRILRLTVVDIKRVRSVTNTNRKISRIWLMSDFNSFRVVM